jgi:hypothetical protein
MDEEAATAQKRRRRSKSIPSVKPIEETKERQHLPHGEKRRPKNPTTFHNG